MPIVSCPDCNKRLKLQTMPRSGRRIKCPSCESVFTPEIEEERAEAVAEKPEPKRRPRPQSDNTEDEEDERPRRKRQRDNDEEEEIEEERPVRKGKREADEDEPEEGEDRPAPKKKKKKKKKQGTFPWVLVSCIGGGVIAVGLLVFFVFFNRPESPYSKNQKAISELLDIMNEMVDIGGSIKDASSAKDAAPKIDRLTSRIEDLNKRAKDLPKTSTKDQERLRKEFESKLRNLAVRAMQVNESMERWQSREPTLRQAIARFTNATQELKIPSLEFTGVS